MSDHCIDHNVELDAGFEAALDGATVGDDNGSVVSALVRGYLLVVPIVFDEGEEVGADTALAKSLKGAASIQRVVGLCEVEVNLEKDLLQDGSHFLLWLGFHDGGGGAVDVEVPVTPRHWSLIPQQPSPLAAP